MPAPAWAGEVQAVKVEQSCTFSFTKALILLSGLLRLSTPLSTRLPQCICTNSFPTSPTMIFFGGMLQIIGATMEWVLGNTFPMCLFFTYGTFWIVAGTQLVPAFGTGIQYAPAAALTATGTSAFQANILGQTQAEYFATFGFYYLSLAMLTVIFAVCSLRTNIVFFSALTTLVFAFGCAAGAFWNLALGNVESGQKLTVVSIACCNSRIEHDPCNDGRGAWLKHQLKEHSVADP